VRFFNLAKNKVFRSAVRVRRGLSLVEVMISLAISAMLLTAVAAAFTASSDAIQVNDEFFRASQAARVSMNQILTEVRRAQHVDPPTAGGTRMFMQCWDHTPTKPSHRTYAYDAANRKLMLITENDATDPDYTMASNCTTARFDADLDATGVKVLRLSVTIVVQVGQNQIRLTGSASPRKAQTWQN
jgi:prepilin-type N-terminal cleavage/methylation domain-containing protein